MCVCVVYYIYIYIYIFNSFGRRVRLKQFISVFRRLPQIKIKPISVHEGEAFKKLPSIVHLEGIHPIMTKLKHKSLKRKSRLKQRAK